MTDREPEAGPRSPGGWTPAIRAAEVERRPANPPADRTIVPSLATAVAIAIHPEIDKELFDLPRRTAQGTPLERMLRGDHLAMVEVVDAVAGADGRQRRSWELLLGGLVEAMAAIAVRESVIDLPMGTAFWDSFTVEQCRRLIAALASMGYRYDGEAGWQDGRVPAYRDMAQALADIGLEPRRVRAWPNSTEIASLFVGARPAPEELVAAAGPAYTEDDMRSVLGEHAAALSDLWQAWDVVRPVLLEDPVAAEAARVGHASSEPAG
jgi:hypothetical protein